MRRELLYSLIGGGVPDEEPLFTVLLAANAAGRAHLASLRKDGGFPVIVKPADTSSLDEDGKRQYALHRAADELYAALTGTEAGIWMKQNPRMV